MDHRAASEAAKRYIEELYSGEGIVDLGLEEVDFDESHQRWTVAIAFSRPWKTPRTRAQEVLENLGAYSAQRRTVKMVTLSDDGALLSVKNMPQVAAE